MQKVSFVGIEDGELHHFVLPHLKQQNFYLQESSQK
jgi:hypothetical protein